MAAPAPRAGVLDIAPYVPGRAGGLEDAPGTVLLSSNESPFGPSAKAVAAARAAARVTHRYADPSAAPLREALAARHGIAAGRIVCGAGSDELSGLLARGYAGPGDEVVYSRHGFVMYPIAARAAGARPVAVAERDLRFDVEATLAAVTARTRVVFVANPNNPTGSWLARAEIARLRRDLPDHVLLVVDAAYAEYADDPDYDSGLGLARRHANVVMTRTFSKIHALAGLRVGWAYAAPEVVDVLHRLRGPFNVSNVGIAAATAALDDPAHEARAKAHNARWRPRLARAIAALGLTVYPSIGNFVLVRFPKAPKDAAAAHRFLARRKVLVRPVGSYGLPDCLRITVGRAGENRVLLAALEAFMRAS
ncbi:MAG: histidinol-phosphate transaminase [Alphaproteobacteria bacterium]